MPRRITEGALSAEKTPTNPPAEPRLIPVGGFDIGDRVRTTREVPVPGGVGHVRGEIVELTQKTRMAWIKRRLEPGRRWVPLEALEVDPATEEDV